MPPKTLHKAPFAMYGLLLAVLLMASLAGCTGRLGLAPYSASGRVCDELGNPIRWVAIEANGHPGIRITDANGVWTWYGLTGTTTLAAKADDWSFSPSSRVVNGPTSGVDFVGSRKVGD